MLAYPECVTRRRRDPDPEDAFHVHDYYIVYARTKREMHVYILAQLLFHLNTAADVFGPHSQSFVEEKQRVMRVLTDAPHKYLPELSFGDWEFPGSPASQK